MAIYVKPTNQASGNVFDIHDDAVDLLLRPVNDDVACPWDADISVENGVVTITGGIAPSGTGGKCTCQCSVDQFSRYYILEVPQGNTELQNALNAAGWILD